MNALSPELALIDDEIDRRAESARAVHTNPELLPSPSVQLQARRATLPVAVVFACFAVLAVTLLLVGPGDRAPASRGPHGTDFRQPRGAHGSQTPLEARSERAVLQRHPLARR